MQLVNLCYLSTQTKSCLVALLNYIKLVNKLSELQRKNVYIVSASIQLICMVLYGACNCNVFIGEITREEKKITKLYLCLIVMHSHIHAVYQCK